MGYRFEWDDHKSASNEVKHGISFEEATLAFDDPKRVFELDTRHTRSGGFRWFCFGMVKGRVATVRSVSTVPVGGEQGEGVMKPRNGKPRYTKEPSGVAAAIRDGIIVEDFLPPPEVLRHAPRVIFKNGTGEKVSREIKDPGITPPRARRAT
jgi:uncharacterized DUF497 family protein